MSRTFVTFASAGRLLVSHHARQSSPIFFSV
jgi:hypothetical protein